MGGGTAHPLQPVGVISPANQSGLILILTGLSLSFVLVSFVIRVCVRHQRELWKLDDNILTGATLLACVQSAIVVRGVDVGLGDRERETLDIVLKFYLSNQYLYLAELFLSKAAVAALYFRLTSSYKHRIAIWTILGTCTGWFVLAILLISISFTWISAYSIPFSRWLVIGILDMATEIALCLMSVYLVKDLKLPFDRKASVVSAFSVRLCTIIPCAIRLYYLEPLTLSSNRTLATSLAVVTGQLQLGIAIMSASIAVLKPFMVVYDKSIVKVDYASRTSRTSYGGAYNYTPHSVTGDTGIRRNTKRPPESQDLSAFSQNSTQSTNSHNSTNSHKSKRDSRRIRASVALQSLRSNLSIRSAREREDDSNRTTSTVISHSHDPDLPSPFAGCGRSTRIITSGRFPSLVEDLEYARRQDSEISDDASDNDKKMIINRRDEWSVRYEDAEPGFRSAELEVGHAHGHEPCLHRAVGMGPSVNGKGVGAIPEMDDLELGPMLGSNLDLELGPKGEVCPSFSSPRLETASACAPAEDESTLRQHSISSHDYATTSETRKSSSVSQQLPVSNAETPVANVKMW